MTPLLLRFEFRILPDLEDQCLSLVSLFLFRARSVLQELITETSSLSLFKPAMSLCLNPDCLYNNNYTDKFCQKCCFQLLLKDRYRAIKLIGQGGFGKTFQAIDRINLLNLIV